MVGFQGHFLGAGRYLRRALDPKALVAWAAPGIVGPMARPLPVSRACALLALALVCACNSDEPLSETTEINLTTGSAMTEIIEWTTGDVGMTSTGEPDEGDQTCRKAEMCLIDCFNALPTDMNDPEQDFGCFFDCTADMSTEQVLALFDLAICTYDDCFARMQCSEHGENDDMMCRDCIILGLFATNPYPPACEAEAAACK